MQVEAEVTSIPPGSLKDEFSTSTPLIYADQIMGIAIGPFVTRITVGIEDHVNNKRTTSATLVMPTNMLHGALGELVKQLSAQDTRNQFEEQYKDYLRISAAIR